MYYTVAPAKVLIYDVESLFLYTTRMECDYCRVQDTPLNFSRLSLGLYLLYGVGSYRHNLICNPALSAANRSSLRNFMQVTLHFDISVWNRQKSEILIPIHFGKAESFIDLIPG